jgi:uncharacterized protein (TIGR03083 family)
MAETAEWIRALRSSHDRFVAAARPLDAAAVAAPSYDDEWSIAQVASHLGSQAEIFGLFLEAGLSREEPPGGEVFGPIWDEWNARSPEAQVAESIVANEAFVRRLEQLPDAERAAFALSMFGMDLDLAGLAAMRLGEHAVHTWDIVVALDPDAVIPADAVALLIDTLPTTAARAGKPTAVDAAVTISTAEPERRFVLATSPAVELTPAETGAAGVVVPAEALVRLVFGRLDPAHTPPDIAGWAALPDLRAVFPGF